MQVAVAACASLLRGHLRARWAQASAVQERVVGAVAHEAVAADATDGCFAGQGRAVGRVLVVLQDMALLQLETQMYVITLGQHKTLIQKKV